MPYNSQLIYRLSKDAENPANFMSRHPSNTDSEECNIAEDYVNYICNQSVPTAMTPQEIKLESEKDIKLQVHIKAIETEKYERRTVGLPMNCTEGKQDRSPESTKRQSRGPSTRWAPRNREKKTRHPRKSLISRCRYDG